MLHLAAPDMFIPSRRTLVCGGQLPEKADPTKVSASYKNGVLNVSIGKSESKETRMIPVKVADVAA